MADGQVKRQVVIELALAAAQGNKAAATAFNTQVQAAAKQQVQAAQSVATQRQAINDKAAARDKAMMDKQRRDYIASQREQTSVAERERKKQADTEIRLARLNFQAHMRMAAQREAAEKRLAAQQAQAARMQQVAGQKFAQATAQGISGVLEIARGLAIVGISSEQNMQRLVQMFLKIEGGVSVVRGLVVVWKQVEAAIAAANAMAAAHAVLSAGGAAGGAGKAVGGAAGAAVGGAAAGAAVGRFGGLRALAGGTAARFGPALSGLGKFAGAVAIGDLIGGHILGPMLGHKPGMMSSELVGLGLDKLKQMETADKLKSSVERRKAGAASAIERGQAQSQFRLNNLAGQQEIAAMSGGSDRDVIARQRALAQQALTGAQANQGGAGRAFDPGVRAANERAALEEVLAVKQNIAALDQRSAELSREKVQASERNVATAERELAIARQKVAAERQQADSALARFGRLGAGEQKRAKDIAGKVQAGQQISRADAEFLESIGLGGKVSGGFFSGQGKSAGGEGVLGILGDMDGLKEARRAEQEAIANVSKAQQEHADAVKQLNTDLDRLSKTINDLVPVFEQLRQSQSGAVGLNPGGATGGLPAQVDNLGRATERAVGNAARRADRMAQAMAVQRI